MSLNDVDKTNDNRKEPIPNASDNVPHRMAHNTYGNTHRQVNSSVTPRMRFMNGLILTYDSEGRVSSAYGYVPEVSTIPIFVIAKDGYDVFEDILLVDAPVV